MITRESTGVLRRHNIRALAGERATIALVRWLIASIVLVTSLHTAHATAPKISEVQAKKIALAKVPGTVVHDKLEHSKKKKHDHWNIKITPKDHPKAGKVKKVEIDAETGAVLKVKDAKAKGDD